MNKIEKKFIDQLIEKSEKTYPIQYAVSECFKEHINNGKTDELSSFIEFYNNIFVISKKQVNDLYSNENIPINIDEAVRIATAKNLFECLSSNDKNFLGYLKEKENSILEERTAENIIEL